MRRVVALALVMVAAGVCGLAQAADQPRVAGTWKWTVNFGGQTREATLQLRLEGGKLIGTLVRSEGQKTPIENAKYNDGELSFTVVRERDGQKMTSTYSGKVSGDTIKGAIEFERNGQKQRRDWEAKRAPRVNPSGTWKWSVSYGGQTHEMALKLKRENRQVTGAIVRDGKEAPIQDVTYRRGELSFKVVREVDGQKMTASYNGKVSEDAIKGKVEFGREGQTQSRDWEAKRVKE